MRENGRDTYFNQFVVVLQGLNLVRFVGLFQVKSLAVWTWTWFSGVLCQPVGDLFVKVEDQLVETFDLFEALVVCLAHVVEEPAKKMTNDQ